MKALQIALIFAVFGLAVSRIIDNMNEPIDGSPEDLEDEGMEATTTIPETTTTAGSVKVLTNMSAMVFAALFATRL